MQSDQRQNLTADGRTFATSRLYMSLRLGYLSLSLFQTPHPGQSRGHVPKYATP